MNTSAGQVTRGAIDLILAICTAAKLNRCGRKWLQESIEQIHHILLNNPPISATPTGAASDIVDYNLKKGDRVRFSFKVQPKEEDFYQAEILDINWSCRAAAIKIEGFEGVTCVNVSSLQAHPAEPAGYAKTQQEEKYGLEQRPTPQPLVTEEELRKEADEKYPDPKWEETFSDPRDHDIDCAFADSQRRAYIAGVKSRSTFTGPAEFANTNADPTGDIITYEILLNSLAEHGGKIVSTASLTSELINEARQTGRLYVDKNNFGYVWLPLPAPEPQEGVKDEGEPDWKKECLRVAVEYTELEAQNRALQTELSQVKKGQREIAEKAFEAGTQYGMDLMAEDGYETNQPDKDEYLNLNFSLPAPPENI